MKRNSNIWSVCYPSLFHPSCIPPRTPFISSFVLSNWVALESFLLSFLTKYKKQSASSLPFSSEMVHARFAVMIVMMIVVKHILIEKAASLSSSSYSPSLSPSIVICRSWCYYMNINISSSVSLRSYYDFYYNLYYFIIIVSNVIRRATSLIIITSFIVSLHASRCFRSNYDHSNNTELCNFTLSVLLKYSYHYHHNYTHHHPHHIDNLRQVLDQLCVLVVVV